MGKVGRTYTRPDYLADTNSSDAYRRFDQPSIDSEDRKLRHEITAAIIALICVLGFIGWVVAF
jgi:hypothetical protein